MRALKASLRQGDPLNVQSGLSADDARVMRQVIVAAANESRTVDWAWPRPFLTAATIGLALAIGVGLGTRMPARDGVVAPVKTETIERRQIQFETPGGTRIIWVLNPDFSL